MGSYGRLISIEGIDGAGKSQQAEHLAARLSNDGFEIETTFEPGGGENGELFRHLLARKHSNNWTPETEALLFTAARRHHLDSTILPALTRGKTVITDRFADSTRIYQGFSNPHLRRKIDALQELMIELEPNLTFIIDIPVEVALTRVKKRSGGDERLEQFGLRLEELRQSFVELGKQYSERCKVIDGNRDPKVINDELFHLTAEFLT